MFGWKKLTLNRRKSGEIVVVINTEETQAKPRRAVGWLGRLTRGLVRMLVWWETRSLPFSITSAMGLGLGICVAWFVYSQPISVLADPPPYQIEQFEITAVRFSQDDYWTSTSGKPFVGLAAVPVPKARLSWTQVTKLQSQSLGQELEILGANNGIYTFKIIEVRHLKPAQMPSLISTSSDHVLVYAPTHLLATEYVVLTASP